MKLFTSILIIFFLPLFFCPGTTWKVVRIGKTYKNLKFFERLFGDNLKSEKILIIKI